MVFFLFQTEISETIQIQQDDINTLKVNSYCAKKYFHMFNINFIKHMRNFLSSVFNVKNVLFLTNFSFQTELDGKQHSQQDIINILKVNSCSSNYHNIMNEKDCYNIVFLN